ncbi:capsular exopolysaccharide synthesis family protein [Paenibacillus phyllosphaerae]|uniref:non-specific protein-tyrosine kinase n=1 Tax=Paenibacillus phyllosphaerae TaxID=274593 RepID=A0A7W5ATN8_9BACL|nr:CpsD/CapB family tyrosine-protein kinase [Paenibacillus phyllosphaerae]MBB3108573.1 capsular exopolysaccharide synthesis family protein [Paenibacillus phyllosphaerae]
MPRSTKEKQLALISTKSVVTENYRNLRTNIQYASTEKATQVILISSAKRSEGKTTTSSNLAVAYANEGKRVMLIDADLRNPALHNVFSIHNTKGLCERLVDESNTREVIRETGIAGLSLITSGIIPINSAELVSSEAMKSLIDELRNSYDVIIIDSPPVLLVSDGLALSTLCDGVVMVIDSKKTEKIHARKAKMLFEHVNARLIGVVLNNVKSSELRKVMNYR